MFEVRRKYAMDAYQRSSEATLRSYVTFNSMAIGQVVNAANAVRQDAYEVLAAMNVKAEVYVMVKAIPHGVRIGAEYKVPTASYEAHREALSIE